MKKRACRQRNLVTLSFVILALMGFLLLSTVSMPVKVFAQVAKPIDQTEIIMDKIPPVYSNSTFTVSGRLIDTATGQGIDGKQIQFNVSNDTAPIISTVTQNITIVQMGGIDIHSCATCNPDVVPDRGGLDWDDDDTLSQVQNQGSVVQGNQSSVGNQMLYLGPGGTIIFPPDTLEVVLHLQDIENEMVVVEVTKGNPAPNSTSTFNATSYGSVDYVDTNPERHTSDFHIASNETIQQIRILSIGGQYNVVGIGSLETFDHRSQPPLRHYIDFEDLVTNNYQSPLFLDSGRFFAIGKAQFVPAEKPKPWVEATFAGDGSFMPSKSGLKEYRTLGLARLSGTGGDPVDPLSVIDPAEWPYADAGSDQTVGESTRVYLDGTLSYDLQNTPEQLTYEWSPVDLGGFTESEIAFDDPRTNIASFIVPDLDSVPGAPLTMQFKLEVTDSDGKRDDDFVDVTVQRASDAFGVAGEPGSVVASNELTFTSITCGTGNDDDNDGLCDAWETSPYRITYGGSYYYLCGSSNPHFTESYSAGVLDNACPSASQKDVYIEIDYMPNHVPDVAAIEDVIGVFETVGSGDKPLINMHISKSNQVGTTEILDLHVWKDTDQVDGNDFLTIKTANFGNGLSINQKNAYANAAHYALYAHTIGACGPSGLAEINGNDMIISLGCGFQSVGGHVKGSTNEQAGTFMHELGHNFNLRHGGNVDMNCKANYQSVMKYSQQLPDAMGLNWKLDYSRKLLGSLVENSLIEANGVTGETYNYPYLVWGTPGLSPGIRTISATSAPINWDQDANSAESGTAVSPRDPNNLGISGCGASASETENGYQDWNNLQMDPSTGTSFDGVYPVVDEESELTAETLKQIRQQSRNIWADSVTDNNPMPVTQVVSVTGSTSNAFPSGDFKVTIFWGDGATNETSLSSTGNWGPLTHAYDQSAAGSNALVIVKLLKATNDQILAESSVTTIQVQKEIKTPVDNFTIFALLASLAAGVAAAAVVYRRPDVPDGRGGILTEEQKTAWAVRNEERLARMEKILAENRVYYFTRAEMRG